MCAYVQANNFSVVVVQSVWRVGQRMSHPFRCYPVLPAPRQMTLSSSCCTQLITLSTRRKEREKTRRWLWQQKKTEKKTDGDRWIEFWPGKQVNCQPGWRAIQSAERAGRGSGKRGVWKTLNMKRVQQLEQQRQLQAGTSSTFQTAAAT